MSKDYLEGAIQHFKHQEIKIIEVEEWGLVGDDAIYVKPFTLLEKAEIFKGSKMIRIYQKEDSESLKAKEVIDDLVEKNIKIGSIVIRATPIMETLTGFMIAGFIYFSGKLIAVGELEVNNFFSFSAEVSACAKEQEKIIVSAVIFFSIVPNLSPM